MPRIVLRVRPAEVMDDLRLALIQERARRLPDWDIEVHDTRLSDAPYISIAARMPAITEETVARLKAAFADLPGMRVLLWQRVGVERSLQDVDPAILSGDAD